MGGVVDFGIGRPDCFCGEDDVDDDAVEGAVDEDALDDVDEKELEDTDRNDDVDNVNDDDGTGEDENA